MACLGLRDRRFGGFTASRTIDSGSMSTLRVPAAIETVELTRQCLDIRAQGVVPDASGPVATLLPDGS
jgi:hypothetical protein